VKKIISILESKLIRVAIVLVVALAVTTVLFFLNSESPAEKKRKQLTAHLEVLGKEFYTELFYKQLLSSKSKEEALDFLKKHEKIGINASIDNLSRTASDENKVKIKEFNYNGKDCDRETTKVYVYPKSPYGQDDYTIKTELKCGFEDDVKKS